MINGVAKLTREDYCDGLGNCLPSCPTGAISFEEREAPAYDEAAVLRAQAEKAQNGNAPSQEALSEKTSGTLPCGCPGTQSRFIMRQTEDDYANSAADTKDGSTTRNLLPVSQLRQWPVQIKLVPINAPYFDNANLLIAADCTAYAYANFHNEFIRNHITLIGCPKLDEGNYAEKLTHIIANNNIKSVTIVRMEVPCCGGIEHAAKQAIQASGKFLPWNVVTISTDGKILDF